VSQPAAYATLPPGTVLLGKYRIVRDLGAGGMGMVVCADHLGLGTRVAMKFLLPEFAVLPGASERFDREARAATRIRSEHVARVYDVGSVPGDVMGLRPPSAPDTGEAKAPDVPFIVMEYLEGKDLGRHLKASPPLSIHEAIDFAVQAAEALAHAHAAGVIHRDVKPANLFLMETPDGSRVIKMLDFGISKVVEEAAQVNLELTKTTSVMGSALYMSLEQMRSTKTVDRRTDVYALGVTLYELLTRSHPFTAESFSELCVKVSLDPPVPIRGHRPEVSEELAEVIARAYARYPDDRWPTVGSFAAALGPFAAEETQATIAAIQRVERASSGELPRVRMLTPLSNKVVKVQRPSRVPWTLVGAAALVGAALAGTAWSISMKRAVALLEVDAGSGGDLHGIPSASAPGVDGSAPVQPASVSVPTAPPSGGAVVGPPGPSGGSSAAVGKPPAGPCKPGQVDYLLPSGLRKLCPKVH
jgi:eukaryotic-like serine/threonine-protein kinase